MRLYIASLMLGALLAWAPGAAAQCTDSSTTTDLGAAQVTQYEGGCTYNWGSYGYEYAVKGAGVSSGDTSANAELWKWHSWGTWGYYTYDSLTHWGSVYGTTGGKSFQVDAGAELDHYESAYFCIDGAYYFVYVPPTVWGGWWGSGPGNNLLPPFDVGGWADVPCTGLLPLKPPA